MPFSTARRRKIDTQAAKTEAAIEHLQEYRSPRIAVPVIGKTDVREKAAL
ncbi:MAG: type I restriction endonuclease subunit S [Gemmatimonadetes bacterium]|nr:type I restriction endonuclease subunit S [Gemmatimonadota bacterium]MYC74111.1 type I restriction endonuclease subunit S [Gemmatimonadota bacterium]